MMSFLKPFALKLFKWLGPLVIEILYDRLLTDAIQRAEKEVTQPGHGIKKMKMVVDEVKRRAPEVIKEVGERKIKSAVESHLDKALKKL